MKIWERDKNNNSKEDGGYYIWFNNHFLINIILINIFKLLQCTLIVKNVFLFLF